MRRVLLYTALWPGLAILGFVNGTLREVVLVSALGVTLARQLSVFILIGLVFLYTWLAARRWPIGGRAAAVAIGLLWGTLTVLFEGVLIVVVSGEPLEAALAQYDVLSGSLWPLVPLAVAFSPLVVTLGSPVRAGP